MADRMLPYSEIPITMIEADFLSASEFRVCLALHSLNFYKEIFPSQNELADKAGLSRITVVRVLDELKSKGIIEIKPRTTENGRFTTNEYSFVYGGWNEWYAKRFGDLRAPKFSGKKIILKETSVKDSETVEVVENKTPFVRAYNDFIFSDRLKADELRVFLYLKRFSNCKEIYPSYKMICERTNLSKHSVVNAINSLSEKGLLEKLETILAEGGHGSNRYLIKNDPEIREWLKNK